MLTVGRAHSGLPGPLGGRLGLLRWHIPAAAGSQLSSHRSMADCAAGVRISEGLLGAALNQHCHPVTGASAEQSHLEGPGGRRQRVPGALSTRERSWPYNGDQGGVLGPLAGRGASLLRGTPGFAHGVHSNCFVFRCSLPEAGDCVQPTERETITDLRWSTCYTAQEDKCSNKVYPGDRQTRLSQR